MKTNELNSKARRLTPEILAKMGFSKDKSGGEYSLEIKKGAGHSAYIRAEIDEPMIAVCLQIEGGKNMLMLNIEDDVRLKLLIDLLK